MTDKDWTYVNPTKVVFGDGSLDRIDDLIAGRRYAVVTYDEAPFHAMLTRITKSAGAPAVVVDNIVTNPDFEALTQSSETYAGAGGIELVIALGGGSVMDTAKVLAAGNGDFSLVRRFLETGEGREKLSATPIIAVPTTAGTGSEVTCWGTVWDTVANKKYSLAEPSLYPECALVDPELTHALPRALTISTGLDALSHALESIWNVNTNPVSSAQAVAAASEVLDVLPALAENLSDADLRSRMAKAALMSGLAFSNTKTALAHSVSYPITLNHGVPHGIACSFSLPMIMRWIAGHDAICDKALTAIFGSDLAAGADRLEGFIKDLGVGTSPEDHGVEAGEWRDLVRDALAGERGRNFLGDGDAVLAAL